MPRVLGLDLGSASIGWALVDTTASTIVASGVRVFPEGVDRDKQGGEVSKNENRRRVRGQRRQIARRARRKRVLRAALVEAGLYPPDASAQARLEADLDPYDLRARAVAERLEPFEIGRCLVHLAQRRGFLSNRRSDRSKKSEKSKLLAAMSQLAEEIEGSGSPTLGTYLARSIAARCGAPGGPDGAGGPVATPDHRVRGRHTRRQMYDQEFDAIWSTQAPFHPDLLTDDLKYGQRGRQEFPAKPVHPRKGTTHLQHFGLHGILFFQRPMYWPKDAVGFCELEPRLRRCPKADRLAQRARLLQEVNNLRIIESDSSERELTGAERKQIIEYLSEAAERSFDQIRAKIGRLEGTRFNLERLAEGAAKTGGRTKLKGMQTDAILAHKSRFGPGWYKRTETERDQIVETLLKPELRDEEIVEIALTKWGLDTGQAEAVLDATSELPTGYASYSRRALERLIPHLEAGLPLMRNEPIGSGGKGVAANDAIHAAGYLRPDERPRRTYAELPGPGSRDFPDLPNPLVQQALHEVRKVVNAVIRTFGRFDAVHVELAREVRGSIEQRARRRLDNYEREQAREAARDEIRKRGHKPTREAVNRYLLWQEQNGVCIYTRTPISLEQLFGGEIDVDHILPYSRSLDDSMANKVVCFRSANTGDGGKGNQTPREWLAESDPERYQSVLQLARKLPYGKFRKFTLKEVVLDDFINRQLNDTAYICRAVGQYLRHLEGVDVLATKGQLTAELRWLWGLDTVLRNDDLAVKNREDHRHHAVDAIVIACTDRPCLQQLARLYRTGEVVPEPWEQFRRDVEDSVNAINVSHRVRRKVRGALHEDTLYGPTEDPEVYVLRKPVEALSLNEVTKIRDPEVRKKIAERLQMHGLDPGRGKGNQNIPKKVWTEPGPIWMNEEKGIPVRRVRLLKPEKSIVLLRTPTLAGSDGAAPAKAKGTYVKPGSLHHLCIFEVTDTNGKMKRIAEFVSMLEAARRKRNREPIVRRTHPEIPGAKFIMSLVPGEMVKGPKGDDALMVFNTAASTQGQIYFHSVIDARPSSQRTKFVVTANSMSSTALKVSVDPIGRLRRSRD